MSHVMIKTILYDRTAVKRKATSNIRDPASKELLPKLEYPFGQEEKVCRICAEYGDVYIFDELSGKTIADHINTYSQLNISSLDEYPKWLCRNCLQLLESLLKFVEFCKCSRAKLIQVKLQQLRDSSDKLLEHEKTRKRKRREEKLSIELIELPVNNDKSEDDSFIDESPPPPQSPTSTHPPSPRDSKEAEWSDFTPCCNRCQMEFADITEYRNHLTSCNKRLFQVDESKSDDAKRVKKSSKGSFLCEVCGKSMGKLQSLIVHRTTHRNVFPFKCDKCPYRGRTKDLLSVHSRTHLPVRPFACPKCPLRFLTASNLGRHKVRHEEQEPQQCPQCGKTFANKASLARHIADIHTGTPPAFCDICGRRYRRQKNLHKHHLKAHNIKPQRTGRWPAYLLCHPEEEADQMGQKESCPETLLPS